MSIEDKIIWGGLYSVNHDRWNDKSIRNDQIYYQAVPCRRNDGSIWMQDTYQLRRCSMKKGQTQTEAAIQRILSFKEPKHGDWAIRESSDWYHTSNEKLTENNINDYELICDLNDYRPFKDTEDYRDYDAENIVVHVHLFSEHGYSWKYGDIGVKLVRKDAQPVLYNKFLASITDTYKDCTQPSSFNYKCDNMIRFHSDLVNSGQRIHPRDQIKYENMIWLTKRLKEMRSEIDEYFKNHSYQPFYDYENSKLTLSEIHSDMKRYLENDCYCPHEIYDSEGFCFQLFYPNTICKKVCTNENRSAVIAKSSDTSEPQIIIFWHDDKNNLGKIIEARRMDVTENNLVIAKQIIEGLKQDNHSDRYTGKEFPEDINNLINSI